MANKEIFENSIGAFTQCIFACVFIYKGRSYYHEANAYMK